MRGAEFTEKKRKKIWGQDHLRTSGKNKGERKPDGSLTPATRRNEDELLPYPPTLVPVNRRICQGYRTGGDTIQAAVSPSEYLNIYTDPYQQVS